jgi:hypothetical protein
MAFRDTWKNQRSHWTAGTISGAIAGIIMALLVTSVAASVGEGFWTPVYAIGSLFWGVNGLIGGPEVAVVGVILHMAMSISLGIAFAMLIRRTNTVPTALLAGLLFGGAVWALMYFLLVPVINPTLAARMGLMPGWWLFHHLAFGASLATVPIFRELLAARATEAQNPRKEETGYRRAA